MAVKNAGPAGDEVSEVVVKKSRFSLVWVVPIVVVVLGGLLLFRTLRDAGIPVTITFETADGLEAGKTKIKYKDVEGGTHWH